MSVNKLILVWDCPVRVFHWLLVVCFAGAWLSSESERYQLIHYAFGYSACLLVLIRIFWGFVGTRYARFSEFVKSPQTIRKHLSGLMSGHTHKVVGHNPAGALVMIVMMTIMLLITLTGYLSVKEYLGDLMGEIHEVIANIALGLVVLHVAAALVMSLMQKENLVKAMVTGNKVGRPRQGIRYPQYAIGLLILVNTVYFFWLISSGKVPSLTT